MPTNAKDAVGVHLYSDLNEDADAFDPEKVADAEGFFGGRVAWRWTKTGGHASASATTTRALRDDDDDDDGSATDRRCVRGRFRRRRLRRNGGSGGSRPDAEGAPRSRASEDEPGAKTAAQASRLLDRLERAEHAWAVKKQNQMVLDSLKTVRIDATAALTLGLVRSPATGRVKDIARRVAIARSRARRNRARAVPGGPAHVASRLEDC